MVGGVTATRRGRGPEREEAASPGGRKDAFAASSAGRGRGLANALGEGEGRALEVTAKSPKRAGEADVPGTGTWPQATPPEDTAARALTPRPAGARR